MSTPVQVINFPVAFETNEQTLTGTLTSADQSIEGIITIRIPGQALVGTCTIPIAELMHAIAPYITTAS